MELIHDELSREIIETARKLIKGKNIGKITVRDILKSMNLTNRVFYNRFHNIDEVLNILYGETVRRVRESLFIPFNEDEDFKEYVVNIGVRTLVFTYESRQNMSQYIFEADSVKNSNLDWWIHEISLLIQKGKQLGYLKQELDTEALSYSIWCFIRGFNADALTRSMPKEEAVRQFRLGFGCFMDGMRA